jgi:hypothetical protein
LEEYYLYSKVYFFKTLNTDKYEKIKNSFFTIIKFKASFNYMIEKEKFKIDYFFLIDRILKKIYRGVIKIVKK